MGISSIWANKLERELETVKAERDEMLRVFEDLDDCFSQSSPDLIYIKARIKDVLKEFYKLHT